VFELRRVLWSLALGIVLTGCAPAPRAQPPQARPPARPQPQAARPVSLSAQRSGEPQIVRFAPSYLVRGRTNTVTVLNLDPVTDPITAVGVPQIVLFEPIYLVRGRTNTVTVGVLNLDPITAVEVTPAEDVSVRAITLIESRPPRSSWDLVFSVEPGAQPVKRSVVLVSPSARSQPHTIDIATHEPEIRELKIVSVRSSPVELEFTVTVFDVEDDLGDSPKVPSVLSCPPRFYDTIAFYPWKVQESRSPHETILHVKSSGVLASAIRGTCRLVVIVEDKKKYRSRPATATVEFK
jgi:hypothetical protein